MSTDDAILARFREAVEKHRGWEVPYTIGALTAVWVIEALVLLPLMLCYDGVWTMPDIMLTFVLPSTVAWAILGSAASFVLMACVLHDARRRIAERGASGKALEQWLRDAPEACGKAWARTTLLGHTPAGSAWILRVCDSDAVGSVKDALTAAEAPGFDGTPDVTAPAA
jgi:hypothetical protein